MTELQHPDLSEGPSGDESFEAGSWVDLLDMNTSFAPMCGKDVF